MSEQLSVTVYTVDHEGVIDPSEGLDRTIVDYVSLYNGGTHGPPALVAPGREAGRDVQPKARPGDVVLYINTALVPAFKIERLG